METQTPGSEKKNSNSNVGESPLLAPPGAGIPWFARLFLKYYVNPFVAANAPWEQSKIRFEKVTEKILHEIEGLSEDLLVQRVLIPPKLGIEDSSRNWSIAMTLEHLVIVGTQIGRGIEALSAGNSPVGKADTAKVKPFGEMTAAESIESFKKFSLTDYPNLKISSQVSKVKYRHPWFGMMNAQQWYWLLPTHQRLHLEQIQAIKKGLKPNH